MSIDYRKTTVDKSNGLPSTATLVQFKSMNHAAHWFNHENGGKHRTADNAFYGDTPKATANAIRVGDTGYAERAKRIINKIMHVAPAPKTRKKVRAVAGGGYLDVGAAYAGSPVCLVQRRVVKDERAPVKIVFDCSVSGAISAETIERRGAAVLALVQRLSAERAVDLHVIGGLKASGAGTMIAAMPIQTRPLDLGRAAWALSSPSVLRRLFFSCSTQLAWTKSGKPVQTDHIAWAFNDHTWQQKKLCAWYAEQLGAHKDDTLLLESRYIDAGDFNSDEDAAAWVNKTLARFV